MESVASSTVNGNESVDHSKVDYFIGSNRVSTAPPSKVADFVRSKGGHTVITKVLIANNGIAAVKEIRSVRKWAYETFGNERAIEFTVMATPEDLKINAEYIRMADQYVEVPGGTNNNNYANVDVIVDIAERTGVHAVWAGWGHASENPRLPESLHACKNKIVFIGPPGSAMRSLGDKISSTIVAQHADVPCMAWSGTGISDVKMSDGGLVEVDDETYQKACVHGWEEGLERAETIGFPVMIKASEGGGGKGIRKVDDKDHFKQAYNAVTGEVPGSPVFIMKLAGAARHLEVQVLADQYGNAISLFGRDCSVQRRHQKIIEEAPVTIAKPDTFEQMEKSAVRLAKLVGYVSAGTTEFLYSAADDKFYFLELNPRLQVEHPTTEMVSGVNLPAAQLQVAMGLPLHQIRDIRTLYGKSPHGTSSIDFDFVEPGSTETQRRPMPKGHVVAVRITAENPDEGFKPSSGNLQELNFRSSTNVWGYFSVASAGGLHEYADSQFGHIFAYGAERSDARKAMVVALKDLSIRGDFRTTVEYLIKLLETEAFEQNTITTAWLDTLISERLTAERPDTVLAVICGAVTKAFIEGENCFNEWKSILSKGQLPAKELLKTSFIVDFIYEGVKYPVIAIRSGPTLWTLILNGGKTSVGVRPLADGGLLVLLDGRSHTVYWREEVGSLRILIDSKTALIEQESDPTQLRSPSPGKLVRYLVEEGEHIKAGDAYAEIEVMKMYMPLVAAEDGVPQFVKPPGVTLEPGDIIGVLTLDDPSRVNHAKPFSELLPPMGPPSIVGSKPDQRLQFLMETLEYIVQGFDNHSVMQSTLKELYSVLQDPELPYSESAAMLSTLSGRIPAKLETSIRSTIESAQAKDAEFPTPRLIKIIENFLAEGIPQAERATLTTKIAPFIDIVKRYEGGLAAHQYRTLVSILQKYYDVEKLFCGREEDVLLKLRDENRDNLDNVINIALSHSTYTYKNLLILTILSRLQETAPVSALEHFFFDILKALADLDSKETTKVALKAREVLIHCQLPSLEERESQMGQILHNSITPSHYGESKFALVQPSLEHLRDLVDSRFTVYDVLPSFFNHENKWICLAALETYVRRAYRAYSLVDLDYEEGEELESEPLAVKWTFKMQKTGPTPPATPLGTTSTGRVASYSDLTYILSRSQEEPLRHGVMFAVTSTAQFEKTLPNALNMLPGSETSKLSPDSSIDAPGNVVNVAFINTDASAPSEDKNYTEKWQKYFEKMTNEFGEKLDKRGVRRITYCLCTKGQYPSYLTFRRDGGAWSEFSTIRDTEPALAFQLELNRLSNFQITPLFGQNRQIHVYYAVGKENPADCRFFVRALVRPGRLRGGMKISDYLISETDRLVNDVLNALEVAGAQNRSNDVNHIAINFAYNLRVSIEEVQNALSGFINRHGKRLFRLRVTNSEIRIVLEDDQGNTLPLRAIIENVSGFEVKYEAYREVPSEKGGMILKSIGNIGSLHLQPVNFPYPTKESLQPKRRKAHVVGTTYVYDFPSSFLQAIKKEWKTAAEQHSVDVPMPAEPLLVKELVLDEKGVPQEVARPPGSNTIGMVAWIFTMFTPEAPNGRQIIVISNDITFRIGSFGPAEDEFFFAVSELARKLGIPRIYLSANSGARLGIADELVGLFKAAWNDPSSPEKGFRYLYLTPEDQGRLKNKGEGSVMTTFIEEDGEPRYKITDIIGIQEGLGVESLKGSGLIAGATSRAYDDIVTISLVTARSVGIGAYLVRLGQRTIQVEGQPIILTGAGALNKVLGREVYASNLQLGGPQIMYKNGVSHTTAANDLDGTQQIVRWLSYVPASRGKMVPIINAYDSPKRPITYTPPKGAYDPRWFLEGRVDESGEYLSGFLDKGSFQETLSGWAQTVVVGRGRVGGIPLGVIAVETRTIERVVPADPANPVSTELRVMEAGQVWYPNSAFKTGQAIADFNREGIPLIIFANWRGFSGGQQDMFDEVLKRGSLIVDGLSAYKSPVFVYIIPNGELRGGAWVVLDPSINQNGMMEMYADETSRAGVLEPEGIVEIKLKKDQVLNLMDRMDETYRNLNQKLKKSPDSASLKEQITQREKLLWPTFNQMALQFADLHDRPNRMKAKGTISDILNWSSSRQYFYWRLKRRLLEEEVFKRVANADSRLSRNAIKELFNKAFESSQCGTDEDAAVYLESKEGLQAIEKFVKNVIDKRDKEILIEALKRSSALAPQESATLLAKLLEN